MAFYVLKRNPTSSRADDDLTDPFDFERMFVKSPVQKRGSSSDDDTLAFPEFIIRKMLEAGHEAPVPVSSDGANSAKPGAKKKAGETSTEKPKSKGEPSILVDWFETSEAHILNMALPGLTKEGIKLQIERERIISVSGERKKDPEKDGCKWHRRELLHGSFSRKIELPENAKVNEMKAQFQNGVLTVTVPKPVDVVKNVTIA